MTIRFSLGTGQDIQADGLLDFIHLIRGLMPNLDLTQPADVQGVLAVIGNVARFAGRATLAALVESPLMVDWVICTYKLVIALRAEFRSPLTQQLSPAWQEVLAALLPLIFELLRRYRAAASPTACA